MHRHGTRRQANSEAADVMSVMASGRRGRDAAMPSFPSRVPPLITRGVAAMAAGFPRVKLIQQSSRVDHRHSRLTTFA